TRFSRDWSSDVCSSDLLARIVAHSTQSQHPSEFTVAPVGAIEKVLAKAGWSKDDVDLFEINEAFAMVAMMPIDELKLDINKVNRSEERRVGKEWRGRRT